MRVALSHDAFTSAVHVLDESFMQFYRHVCRITRLVITLMPLLAVLVGSCKTSQTGDNMYSVTASAQELRTILFPDRAGFNGVSRARNFVEAMPQAMLLMTRDEIGYLFGKPTFHRHDADAEVWQYKTGGCVVDFYFYGQKPVSYIDARHKDQTPASASEESGCLHNIQQGKSG